MNRKTEINRLAVQCRKLKGEARERAYAELLPLVQPTISTAISTVPYVDADNATSDAMLALIYAIRDYDPKYSFTTFLFLCVRRATLTLKIKQNKDRRMLPLDGSFADILADRAAEQPDEIISRQEAAGHAREVLTDAFSDREWEAYRLWTTGHSYSEIGLMTGTDAKAIDNCLCRAKQKISKLKQEGTIQDRETKRANSASLSAEIGGNFGRNPPHAEKKVERP